METVAATVFPVVLACFAAWGVTREDAKLRRRARRYRELEFEGIEQVRRDDPYPEQALKPGAFLREPDGSPTNADRLLREELGRARDHTLTRGRGSQCLL